MDTPRPDSPELRPSRRGLLSFAAAGGALAALGGLPAFTASAAPRRPTDYPMLAEGEGTSSQLWWQAPADDGSMITQGLPVGNGRLGALVGNDPGRERLFLTDATMWTGDLNSTLDADGQFPYARENFGSFTLLGKLTVEIPDHDLAAVSGYRRTLDLRQGLVTASYVRSGVTYRRQVFASAPDDVVVLRFTQDGGGHYTGGISLDGTHGETTTGTRSGGQYASFGGEFANRLRYGAAVTAYSGGGTVSVAGARISFRTAGA